MAVTSVHGRPVLVGAACRAARGRTANRVGFADQLVADAQLLTRSETNRVLLLKKLTQEVATVSGRAAAHRRNAVVLVAEQLGGVPGWMSEAAAVLRRAARAGG